MPVKVTRQSPVVSAALTVEPIVYGAAYVHGSSAERLKFTAGALPAEPRTTTDPIVFPSVTVVLAEPVESVLLDDGVSVAEPETTFQVTVAPTNGRSPASTTSTARGIGNVAPVGPDCASPVSKVMLLAFDSGPVESLPPHATAPPNTATATGKKNESAFTRTSLARNDTIKHFAIADHAKLLSCYPFLH